jgi:hypothetical protein
MKDNYIRFKVESELKEKFNIACDGRTMTNVLIKLMKEYIKKSEDKND